MCVFNFALYKQKKQGGNMEYGVYYKKDCEITVSERFCLLLRTQAKSNMLWWTERFFL